MSNGLTTLQSNFSVKETIDRIVSIAQSKGITIFARIDHAANAIQSGLTLRPTELLIFGNPKAGTFLMQDNQTSGIDLPLKFLAWEDESGKAWLTYNDLNWLAERHNLAEKSSATLKAIGESIMVISNEMVKR